MTWGCRTPDAPMVPLVRLQLLIFLENVLNAGLRIFSPDVGQEEFVVVRRDNGNFFGVAGYEIIDNPGFKSADEGVKAALEAKADIVVACSADDEYAEAVPKIKELIGDKAIVVVAGDPECRPELEAKGIDKYIHVRCNVLETLKEYQAEMGIKEL